MPLSSLFSSASVFKYLAVVAAVGSSAVAPLIYSYGGASRGGRFLSNLFNLNQASVENNTLDASKKEKLKVDHMFYDHLKKTVSLEEFRKIYGTLDFKEEHISGDRVKTSEGPKGAKNMTVLDAWEHFFKSENISSSNEVQSSFFKEGNDSLPFWNYDFPYIAVEFPKEYKIPQELISQSLDKGWYRVDESIKSERVNEADKRWRGWNNTQLRYKNVIESVGIERENHISSKTMNKLMTPSEDAALYLVSQPEKLLKLWLSNWKNDTNTQANEEYALFESHHYKSNWDHPEVTILTRWHEGKIYRMWIHHKTLQEWQIKGNRTIFGGNNKYSKYNRYYKPVLKWGDNFLLNLLAWYAYSYKLREETAPDKTTYNAIATPGFWNLMEIYELDRGANSLNPKYKENFAKWIRDWYSGIEGNDRNYWNNIYRKFSLVNMRPFSNRWERVNWIGQTMDELSGSWGKMLKELRTARKS